MGVWVVPPIAGLVEPAVAPEFYIEGMGAAERIGNNVRLYFCARQLDLAGNAENQVVIVKIVRPIDYIPNAIELLAQVLDRAKGEPPPHIPSIPGGFTPRLVR